MARENRTSIAPERLCPTCDRPLRLHEWRTTFGNGEHTAWNPFRLSCDNKCSMTGVSHLG